MHRLLACALLSLLPLACVVQVNDGGSGDAPGHGDEASKPNGSGSEVAEPVVEAEPPARASVPELPDCPADADADTDVAALRAGYITVTPLQFDLTHNVQLRAWRDREWRA